MTKTFTVSEYLRSIESYGDAVYRGQAKAEWRVDCSAARRLEPDAKGEDLIKVANSLIAYTEILLRGALRHVSNCPELPPGSSDLEILAQLQHQGAATGLIDFTTKSLVALWFACSEHPEEDGAVYILPRSEVQTIAEPEARRHGMTKYFGNSELENPLYLWSPHGLPGRPASQGSVFVLGALFLWPKQLWREVVARDSKPVLLEELRTEHGIADDTLFPDLAGYSHANSVSKPFAADRIARYWEERVAAIPGDRPRSKAQAYVGWGIAYGVAGELEQAIERFTEAISADPETIDAHVNRALTKGRLDDYEGAVSDFDAAIEKLEKAGDKTENGQQLLAHLYWGRGAAFLRSDRKDQGYADLNKSVQLGTKMWAVNKETSGVRLSHFPDSYLEYRS